MSVRAPRRASPPKRVAVVACGVWQSKHESKRVAVVLFSRHFETARRVHLYVSSLRASETTGGGLVVIGRAQRGGGVIAVGFRGGGVVSSRAG